MKGDLSEEEKFTLSRKLFVIREAWKAVRKASFAVEKDVKRKMPRDTGRAAASWGNWTPGLLRMANKLASAADAIFKQDKGSFSITQGSNVEYVGRLNDGHSKQRAAGFIDAAAEKGMEALDDEIDAIMRAF
jgi:hypothetical protein